ncbi:hypothetical protein ANCCEY_11040 [Ancylostoma ceylanicum]|uniref:7TM GPCR serpentine receptor class x (Srx) domain-containing protein n=1 Tax=Ancylostoma ceylanicum TaxID=53326 RepID=A0A0D6LIX3_9BILA|nr:hypothetical protein ANCCEY_11040 [Ancylostoma ceylanicum]
MGVNKVYQLYTNHDGNLLLQLRRQIHVSSHEKQKEREASFDKYPLLNPWPRKSVYVWMVVCVAIMIGRAFVTRPVLYNSAVAAYLAAPEVTHYTSILLPIHNISVIAILGILYVVLCCYVVKIRRAANGSIDKLQIQLFLQALVICASTAIAAVSYVFVEFVPVPRAIVIMANVTWQFSHGVHGIVYIFLNKLIRTEVVDLLRCKKRSKPFFTSTHTMTVVKGSGH